MIATVESLMFWLRLVDPLIVMPRLENVVLQLTDDVLVLWVIDCGLYMLFRLLRS